MEVGLVPAGARPSRQLSLPADRLLSLFGFRPLLPALSCRFSAGGRGGGCNTCIPWFLLPFFGSRQGLVWVLRGGVISQGGLCSLFRQPWSLVFWWTECTCSMFSIAFFTRYVRLGLLDSGRPCSRIWQTSICFGSKELKWLKIFS